MQPNAITPAAIYAEGFARAHRSMAHVSPLARRTFSQSMRQAKPRERLTRVQWAERHRTVATGARKGPFRWRAVPALKAVLEACDDPRVHEVVVRKPSQIGYTVSILMNLLGYHIDQDPCNILVLFPKDGDAKKFVKQKLDVTIEETPVLAAKIDVTKQNSSNTADFKGFSGGFLQVAGANSPSNAKSVDARIGCVEEPDDVTHDVKNQGSPVQHIKARTKTYYDRLLLIGGSPTIEGFSIVSAELELSDKRLGYVRCPHCGHQQTLNWENIEWLTDAEVSHPVYGTHRPETARYRCDDDDCGALWTDAEKNRALRDIEWIATAPFNGVAGFDYSTGGELYSANPESAFAVLVRRYLEAKHEQRQGKDGKFREFVNGTQGRVWKLKADTPEVDDLFERRDDYAPWTVPAGGLVLVGSVDVQRGGEQSGEPRLEWLLRAYGRGLESWKVASDIILGNPLEQAPWDELSRLLARTVKNHAGGHLKISGVSVDSSDGMTSDAVYRFCRTHKAHGVVPVKGWNETGARQKEIFSKPKALDHTKSGKAAKYGLRDYMVGTSKAKDQIHGRLKLPGDGPGRLHFDAETTRDYFEQLTAEAKVPGNRGREVWTKKAGKSNEALDLEVMCLHQAHKLNLHRYDDNRWNQIESELRQGDLLGISAEKPRDRMRDTAEALTRAARGEEAYDGNNDFAPEGWGL